jgi:dCTP deaminase
VEICQIYYHDIEGEFDLYRNGKYQNNTGIQPSLLYKDFEPTVPGKAFYKGFPAML